MKTSEQAYLSRGVSPTKDEVKAAVKDQDKGIFPGAFCKVIEDMAGDDDYCTVVHADGAGTKSSAAYMMAEETGDLSWYRGIAQDSLVMNIDDMMCVGATGPFYVSNTIGRNAHRVSGAAIAEVIRGYDEIVARLKEYGVDIKMTGGETADVGDLVSTLICDSTVVTRIKRSDVINCADMKPGLTIVGLASFGQASYETAENSGIASNGLTAARHLLLNKVYREKYPEAYSDTLKEEQVFVGPYQLTEPLPDSTLTAGEAILSPTRSFLPVMLEVFKHHRADIHALIHCTGGGLVKCRDFGHGIRYVKDNLFERPAIFNAIAATGEIGAKEMYQVFNLGQRLEIYCDEHVAEDIIAIADSFNVAARIIGHTEEAEGENEVIIRDRGEEFVFSDNITE